MECDIFTVLFDTITEEPCEIFCDYRLHICISYGISSCSLEINIVAMTLKFKIISDSFKIPEILVKNNMHRVTSLTMWGLLIDEYRWRNNHHSNDSWFNEVHFINLEIQFTIMLYLQWCSSLSQHTDRIVVTDVGHLYMCTAPTLPGNLLTEASFTYESLDVLRRSKRRHC
jgi:hypothetical protein